MKQMLVELGDNLAESCHIGVHSPYFHISEEVYSAGFTDNQVTGGQMCGPTILPATRVGQTIITWAGQYCLVKGGRCILCDQGGVLEILGPGGRRIGNFGPRWAAYWKFWAQVGRVLGILGPGGQHDS